LRLEKRLRVSSLLIATMWKSNQSLWINLSIGNKRIEAVRIIQLFHNTKQIYDIVIDILFEIKSL